MKARIINIYKYLPKENVFIEGLERIIPSAPPKEKQITYIIYANEGGNFVKIYETPKRKDYFNYGKIIQIEQFNTLLNAGKFTIELENKIGAVMLNEFLSNSL